MALVRDFLSLLLLAVSVAASGQPPYQELPDPKPANAAAWNGLKPGTYAAFASHDERYARNQVPAKDLSASWAARAWKGETVQTQLIVWTTTALPALQLETTPLTGQRGEQIAASNVQVAFLRYVMTNSPYKEGCNMPANLDSALVADALDPVAALPLPARTSRPAWVRVTVPPGTAAGTYRGQVRVLGGAKPVILPFTVTVLDHTLPAPKDWAFHLDLWQNPFAIARVHHVPDWSPAHWSAMRPYLKQLADAGQKVITASIIHDPWNSQTYDPYASMIRWVRTKDGRWTYDYTVFDQWVSYMMALGIDREINCYSMIPWHLTYRYYDEALGRDTTLVAKPGTDAYRAHWLPMLTDFAAHLKAKGWFGKTTIGMDERPLEAMLPTLAVIKAADPGFRVSMAGNYHPELENSLVDYCLPSYTPYPPEVLARRKKQGYISTFYTACPEAYPNTFTYSPPAESAFMGWHAAASGLDGYLRWAYNSWPKDPLTDSRFGKWSGGDTYFVYPDGRSSIRFERLREGIQAYEKVRILRQLFQQQGDTARLQKLEALLKTVNISAIPAQGAAPMVNRANALLNEF